VNIHDGRFGHHSGCRGIHGEESEWRIKLYWAYSPESIETVGMFGYTEQEASFLYLVITFAGFFT